MWKWIKSLFRKKKEVVIKPVVVEKPIAKQPVPGMLKGNFGVDISHHNKKVNLDKLAINVDFIYMKATEGVTFLSPKYKERAAKLKTMDIPWGVYHYYKVNADPISQAEHFLKYVDTTSGLPPVLDIEGIGNNFRPSNTKDLLMFLEYVELKTGITPIIYTGYYFAKDKIKPTQEFAKYDLWIAWYTSDFTRVKVPEPWSQIKIWQYAETGRVGGVTGDVDVNKVMS